MSRPIDIPISDFHIFIIDGDQSIAQTINNVLVEQHYHTHYYPCAEDFLKNLPPLDYIGCILLDIRLPGMNGLELINTLNNYNHSWSIIFITIDQNAPLVIRAIKLGAIDFLIKPIDQDSLKNIVENALSISHQKHIQKINQENVNVCFQTLTPRERQIMRMICEGDTTQQIANKTHLSFKTIEAHRSNLMKKMKVKNASTLVRIALEYNLLKFPEMLP